MGRVKLTVATCPDCKEERKVKSGVGVDRVERRCQTCSRKNVGMIARSQTHCRHGHEYKPETTRLAVRPNGREFRICLVCRTTQKYHHNKPRKKEMALLAEHGYRIGYLKKPTIPTEPVREALREYEKEFSNRNNISRRLGIAHQDYLILVDGNRELMSFPLADKILCAIEQPLLWYTDDRLREAYERGIPLSSVEIPIALQECEA